MDFADTIDRSPLAGPALFIAVIGRPGILVVTLTWTTPPEIHLPALLLFVGKPQAGEWNRHFNLMKSPAAFAAAINADLVKIFGSVVTFATAMCGVIDARAGTLTFTGAGGPTPIIIHENWTVDEPKSTGPPLGVMEDIPYLEKTVNLKPGDSILLFSDGAIEIQNANQEWLGVDGFTQILKDLNYPQMPLRMEMLEEVLLKFSNDIRLQDDITIIEARYSG